MHLVYSKQEMALLAYRTDIPLKSDIQSKSESCQGLWKPTRTVGCVGSE